MSNQNLRVCLLTCSFNLKVASTEKAIKLNKKVEFCINSMHDMLTKFNTIKIIIEYLLKMNF